MLTLPIELDIKTVALSDEQFYQFCISNPDVRAELTAEGSLILMPPVGGYSGNQEFELGLDLGLWNRKTQLGKVFSSSTIFKLPGGGKRSPDLSWIAKPRWEALSDEQRRKFPPIAPDFVMELRSSTDSLSVLQDKMLEYIDNGVRLGWMFDPKGQKVEVYRIGQKKEVLPLPVTLSGEDVLPGFLTCIPIFSRF
ncbi:MAG: Uma2 family endonuclease [Cyanobacteria bacterium P01_D01_bin.36]